MKRLTLITVAALAVCTVAAPLVAQPSASVGQAARAGAAPTVDELMKRVQPPQAFGGEREVLNRVPASLQGRERIDTVKDPLASGFISRQAPSAGISFGGYDSDDNANLFGFRIMPPDTEGDVGLTYYVQYNNLGWKYFEKATGTAFGPFPGNIFWQGFGGVCESDNAGDPIVLYDQFADRWVFSQFTDPGNPDGHQCFAVTQGANPAGPYYLYDFVVSPGQFNDYEKITVWTDGAGQSAYHMSSNEFGASFVGVNATAFDRDAMLAGAAASFVQFSLGTATGGDGNYSLQPAHLEGNAVPPAGTCNKYIQAFDNETWGSGPGADGYRIWTYCVDFNTPSNSTFAETAFITAPAFDAELCGYNRNCIPQPGASSPGLDSLGQFTMYRFANRYFPGSGLEGVISHTVDTGGNVAGVRWAHIDVDVDSLIDTGTLAPGDGVSRWMPSATIDSAGNIGISFTKSSSSVFPSVYFAGREAGDPPGTLQGEVPCIDGTGVQTGGNRWGDYAAASVDPADDCTFWITNEYVENTGSFQWDTQICSYSFASCGTPQTCGNGVIEGTEVCDDGDLGGETCATQGCTGGGTLACNSTCDGFDTSLCADCPVCDNDGVCEAGEDCTNCNDCVGGNTSGALCGNGLCETGQGDDENAVNCPADCNGALSGKPSNRFACGFNDGYAPDGCGDPRCTSDGFNCTEIPQPGGAFCCGDFVCTAGAEDCNNCALDCTTEPGTELTCDDGLDNDCSGAADCADGACVNDPFCQQVDCSTITSKNPCNAEPNCRWDNRNKVCIPN